MAPSKVEKTPDGTPVEGEQSMAGVSATQQAAPAPEPPPAPQSDAEKFAAKVARKLAKLVPDGVTVEADGKRINAPTDFCAMLHRDTASFGWVDCRVISEF